MCGHSKKYCEGGAAGALAAISDQGRPFTEDPTLEWPLIRQTQFMVYIYKRGVHE